jgi:hypothetical protein
MQVTYIGVNCRVGVSEKNGRPYKIAELLYAIPSDNGSSEKKADDGRTIWTYVEYGNKVRTLDLDPSCISRFAKVTPGDTLDLQLDPIPENPSRNHVVGIRA